MKHETVRATAFAMPLTNPAFPPGPYRFINREYFIQYRTDPEALRRVVLGRGRSDHRHRDLSRWRLDRAVTD
jgi:acetoacetate decarboxylase